MTFKERQKQLLRETKELDWDIIKIADSLLYDYEGLLKEGYTINEIKNLKTAIERTYLDLCFEIEETKERTLSLLTEFIDFHENNKEIKQ